jgi:hypothetical protein
MSVASDSGSEKYWLDGQPYRGLRNQATKTTNEKYWLDGMPENNIFPINNEDTGKFFLLFE